MRIITISHAGYIKRTIQQSTKHKIEEELVKSAGTRDQDFLEHVCCDKPSIYDVLYPKKENSGCVFMKYGSKTAKGRAIESKSRAMIRSKHLFVHKI
jgi:hypothetical protein